MKNWLAFILIIFSLLAVRFTVMTAQPVFEPSEARYAAISANMARTGNWFVPEFTYKGTYQTFAGKPPLIFQASAACCKIFGISQLSVRLIPFISFIILLGIVYYTVRLGENTYTARLATGISATSAALFATAGFCMMDSSLTCAVSGALLLYWRFTEMTSKKRRIITVVFIGLLLGLGMMIKGPVALALFGIPALIETTINKRWKWSLVLEAFLLLLVITSISVPYFWAIEQHQSGFIKYFFINENLMRFLVHDYGDKYGAGRETFRGMAVVWAWVVMLPWSLVPIFKFKGLKMDFRSVFRCTPLLSGVVIILFWCLTSRVPLAYLLPVVPLFSVGLAINSKKFLTANINLEKLFPWTALTASLVLIVSLSYVWFFNNKKLPGKSAPPKSRGNYYSYEFYHHPWGKNAPKQ